MKISVAFLILIGTSSISDPPAFASPNAAIEHRAEQVVRFWNGDEQPEALYTPKFIQRAELLASLGATLLTISAAKSVVESWFPLKGLAI